MRVEGIQRRLGVEVFLYWFKSESKCFVNVSYLLCTVDCFVQGHLWVFVHDLFGFTFSQDACYIFQLSPIRLLSALSMTNKTMAGFSK